jgi:hypothetical protein
MTQLPSPVIPFIIWGVLKTEERSDTKRVFVIDRYPLEHKLGLIVI